MPIRITGMNSGLDTEAIITELMSAYRTKGDKYVKEQTKLSWKQDKWKSLNTKIFNFYKKARTMTLSSGYSARKTTVSDATKATVTASGDASNGTHTLRINSIAKSGYLTGAQLQDTTNESTKLSGLGYTGGKTSINLKCNGKEKSLSVDESTTIEDFVKQINDSGMGVKASFDATNHRLYVTSEETGTKADFEFSAANSDARAVMDALGLNSGISTQKITTPDGSDADGNTLISDLGLTDGSIRISANGMSAKNFKVSDYNTVSDLLDAMNTQLEKAGVDAEADIKDGAIVFKSKGSSTLDESTGLKIEGLGEDGRSVLKELGIMSSGGATRIQGTDASIMLNGVGYTSSSNDFNINGLSIKAQAVTDSDITITTEVDVDGIYDRIKEFLTEYNDLMKEMSTLYNAESSKGYEPLTSEEKGAITDTEVEQWEDKIKGALLRRDGTLNSVMSTMSQAMLGTYEIDGKNYSLSTFGIKTLGYFDSEKNERGLYHIDGDQDDEDVADKKDELRKKIQENPDTVISFFQQLSSKLYSNLDEKMKRTELSSVYTVYNDKEMAKSYSDYTETIAAWEKKMTAIEDSYYKKFSAMETALAKLQSQTSSLSSLFG